jgi:DNA replication protein DnaC
MTIDQQLKYLKLHYISDNYELIAKQAAEKQWTHIRYLTELILAQANQRLDRAIERRIYQARFPQIKTLEQFNWSWPKKSISRKCEICSDSNGSKTKVM